MATLKILHDIDPLNPRTDWDHFSVFATWHRRGNYGDVQPRETPEEWLKANAPKGSVVLPVYMYEHSGVALSTAPFACKWDSGQLGYIVATPDAIREAYKVKRISKKVRANVEACLKAEIETYSDWLSGDVWGFEYTDDSGHVDSCWGFIGDMANSGLADAVPVEAKPLLTEAWEKRFEEYGA